MKALRRRLPVGLALAVVGAAVAWALAGLPGAAAACPPPGCDCEAAGPGPLRQPADAWSSLALAAAGTALLALSIAPVPAAGLVLAGTAAFLFHAGLTAWAARLDGIAVGALIAALAVHRWWAPAAAWWRHRRRRGPGDPAGDRRPAGPRRRLSRTLLPWALLALGALCWALGRSGGPWCRPDSWLQAHAAWHLLAAGAVFLWVRHGRSGPGDVSPIAPRPLPSRQEDEAANEPAP